MTCLKNRVLQLKIKVLTDKDLWVVQQPIMHSVSFASDRDQGNARIVAATGVSHLSSWTH